MLSLENVVDKSLRFHFVYFSFFLSRSPVCIEKLMGLNSLLVTWNQRNLDDEMKWHQSIRDNGSRRSPESKNNNNTSGRLSSISSGNNNNCCRTTHTHKVSYSIPNNSLNWINLKRNWSRNRGRSGSDKINKWFAVELNWRIVCRVRFGLGSEDYNTPFAIKFNIMRNDRARSPFANNNKTANSSGK